MDTSKQTLNDKVYLKGKCINHGCCKSNQSDLIEKTLNWT